MLQDGQLKYYKSDQKEDMEIPLGSFNMDHYYIKMLTVDELLDKDLTLEEASTGLYFSFRIHGIDDQIFHFKAETKQDADEW